MSIILIMIVYHNKSYSSTTVRSMTALITGMTYTITISMTIAYNCHGNSEIHHI